MKFIIDRIEDYYAVAELGDKQMINIPLEIIPSKAKEGDVISVEIDLDESYKRKKNINNLIANLWED